MGIFSGFRIRRAERDRETDTQRFERLLGTTTEVKSQMLQERRGLKSRYETASADAAFAQQSLENEGPSTETSTKVEELTDTMLRYTDRIKTLQGHADYLESLEDQIRAFMDQHGLRPKD